jgi:hypothetical protein
MVMNAQMSPFVLPPRGQLVLPSSNRGTVEAVWTELRHLEAHYPGFRAWYWNTVVPGLSVGERKIFVSVTDDCVSGIVIAKAGMERKICTVWVPALYRHRSIARGLMGEALEWLDMQRPLFTVPSFRLAEFHALVGELGFEHRGIVEGYYGAGRVEHVFNGALLPTLQS